MSNFSALKTAIQNAIKQNGNEEITGALLQGILLSIVETLGDTAINALETGLSSEATTRGNADTTLQTNINNEATARQNADSQLQTNINNEATARQNADTQLNNLITGIKNNIDNGYVYAGIATPSTTPVSGKVFYVAVHAGTYTNFGSTAVTQGINILKYNGSVWSKDVVIGIDDEPTGNSKNLVKSGGVAKGIKNSENLLYDGSKQIKLTFDNDGNKIKDHFIDVPKGFKVKITIGEGTTAVGSSSSTLALSIGIDNTTQANYSVSNFNKLSLPAIFEYIVTTDYRATISERLQGSCAVEISSPSPIKELALQTEIAIKNKEIIDEFIDVGKAYPETGYFITADNKWRKDMSDEGVSYFGKMINITPGKHYIIERGPYAVLTEAYSGDGNEPVTTFANGFPSLITSQGPREFVASDNAHCLFVGYTSETPILGVFTTINSIQEIDLTNIQTISGWLSGNIPVTLANGGSLYCLPLDSIGHLHVQAQEKNAVMVFVDKIPTSSTISVIPYSNYSGRILLYAGTSISMLVPDEAKYLLIGKEYDGEDRTPKVYAGVEYGNGIMPRLNKLENGRNGKNIVIASYDSNFMDKERADIICSQSNAELGITLAINTLIGRNGGKLIICGGTYEIGSFDSNNVAIPIAAGDAPIDIIGDYSSFMENGVFFVLPESVYEQLDDNTEYSIFKVSGEGNSNHGSFTMENIGIRLYNNQKKVICLNTYKYGGVERIAKCRFYGWNTGSSIPEVATEGCIGILDMNRGSNWGTLGHDFNNVSVAGFYEGIAYGVEHILATHCSAVYCVYGWTFNTHGFPYGGGYASHPIVMIECTDERNVNFPLFGEQRTDARQSIIMVGCSTERIARHTPGGVLGDYAKEVVPGRWTGEISIRLGEGNADNTFQYWEFGHGHGVKTKVLSHKEVCDSTTRLSYQPTYGEQIFDTTLNKLVVCIDDENKTWVDTNGNVVD